MVMQRSARPCPGPHRGKEPPLTSQPLCDFCRDLVRKAIEQLPEQYVTAYLALEPGQRGRDDDGGRRSRSADAPLPLDAEADALMRRILEVVLSWHGPVIAAARLTATPPKRRPQRANHIFTKAASDLLDKDGELILARGGPSVKIPPTTVSRPLERGDDDTTGVALTSACQLLVTHLDTLLGLPVTPMSRSVPPGRVRNVSRAPIPSLTEQTVWTTVTVPLLADDTLGRVRADGRAIVIVDLDGVAAGLEFLELARDAERTLGRTLRTVNLERPCPNPDCGEAELHHTEGDDFVRCRACGEKHFATSYDRLAVVLGADLVTGETMEAS